MTKASPEDISQLLKAWGQGDETALNRLMPLVYNELRRRAHRQMAREKAGHTLETTALLTRRICGWLPLDKCRGRIACIFSRFRLD